MLRQFVTALLIVPLLGGCGHVISGMKKNMEADQSAFEVCIADQLTLEAQQVLHKKTVSSLIANRIGFPDDGTFDDQSLSVSAFAADFEERLRAAYVFLVKLAETELDAPVLEGLSEREKEDITEALAKIDAIFDGLPKDSFVLIRDDAKKLSEEARTIRNSVRDIAKKLQRAFVQVDTGVVTYKRYGPSIVTAAADIRSDIAALRVSLAEFQPEFTDFVNRIERLTEKSHTDHGKLGAALDELAGVARGILNNRARNLPDKTNKTLSTFIELQAQLNDLGDFITTLESSVWAPLQVAVEKATDILHGLRNGLPLEDILHEYDVLLLEDLIATIVRYRVARLASRRLEKGIFVIEDRLNQIDDKAWLLIALARVMFSDGIRDALASSIKNALKATETHEREIARGNEPGSVDADRDGAKEVAEGFVLSGLAQQFYQSNDVKKKSDPGSPDGNRELYNNFKFDDVWLQPLTVAACERILVDRDLQDVSVARTDQLLAPIYWAIIEAYKARKEDAPKTLDKAFEERLKAYLKDRFSQEPDQELVQKLVQNAFVASPIETLWPDTQPEPKVLKFGANPIRDDTTHPMTAEEIKEKYEVGARKYLKSAFLRAQNKLPNLADGKVNQQLQSDLSSKPFFDALVADIALLRYQQDRFASMTLFADFGELNARLRRDGPALDRVSLICTLKKNEISRQASRLSLTSGDKEALRDC